jgi:transposase-like protein
VSKLSSLEELFAGRHFDREVIIPCVRWYLRYKLSFRNLVEMMAERELNLAHTTILRWVRRYTPEFVKRWNRFGRTCGRSCRVNETGPNSLSRRSTSRPVCAALGVKDRCSVGLG